MKTYRYIAVLAAALAALSCVADKGNYDYIPKDEFMPVTIGGIEPHYSFLYGNTAEITPQLTGITEGLDLEYVWYMYCLAGTEGRDTLGRERNLNVKITQPIGNYQLIYVVRDRKNDVFVSANAIIAVGTIFSDGWFIVEDNGSDTDVDLLSVSGGVREGIVAESTGARLEGKGVKITPHITFDYLRDNHDGTVTKFERKTAFYICSQRDMKVFSSENMEVFYDFEDCFYEVPQVRDVRNVDVRTDGVYLNNDGKVYYYSPMSSNTGKFSAPNIGIPDADLNIYEKWCTDGSETLVFDEISRSFYRVYGSDTLFRLFSPPNGNDYGPTLNTGKEMVDLVYWKSEYIPSLYSVKYYNIAVMKDDDKGYIYTMAYLENLYPFVEYQELPRDSPVMDGNSVRAMHSAQKVMFFTANGSELHRFELGRPEPYGEPIVFPGETISFMKHFKAYDNSVDCFGVLTNTADGKWKFYTIPFMGGASEFETDAVTLVGTGEGTGRYVMRLRNNAAV